MANGWAAEGAVQEQIDSTVNDGIERVRQSLGQGKVPQNANCAASRFPKPAVRHSRACVIAFPVRKRSISRKREQSLQPAWK